MHGGDCGIVAASNDLAAAEPSVFCVETPPLAAVFVQIIVVANGLALLVQFRQRKQIQLVSDNCTGSTSPYRLPAAALMPAVHILPGVPPGC